MVRPLLPPAPDFSTLPLHTVEIHPSCLLRVSSHQTGEPYFGRSAGNRFDDPKQEYGTCYTGGNLMTALAESILHDLEPSAGRYRVAAEDVARRFVHEFEGAPLRIAELRGRHLNILGGHGELCGTTDYALTQTWSVAVHSHPDKVDGFRYMSRLLTDQWAVVLFYRGNALTMRQHSTTPLASHPDYHQSAHALGMALH